MMSIIVSSDSVHKGRRHVERVMDAWLPRISSNTWAGYLSRESIKKIVEQLNSCARGTKNTMAVSIIWEHDHRFEQIAFVGNRKRLEEGLAALGKAKTKFSNRKTPDFIKSLMLAARLAGKTHDLGKATDFYQRWFLGGERDISIRHERISAQILNNLFSMGKIALDDAEPVRHSIDLYGLPDWQAIALAAVATHHGKREEAFSKPDKAFELIAAPRQMSDRLADEIATLADRLKDRPMPEAAYPLALFSARMGLMLGDYAQSSFEKSMAYAQEGEWHTEPKKGAIYAKSKPLVPLRAHLDNVASRAQNVAKAIFQHDWPALAPFEKPDLMKRTPKGRFAWQHRAEYLIRGMNLVEHDAAFIVLAAETGSGKTLGGYRIMSALRDDRPRFNFAVGFGALAVQTEVEYRSMLGLSQDQAALVVGKRFRKQEEISDKDEEFDEEIEVLHGRDDAIPESLKSALNNKMRRIIATPVVVTTIDHLVSAAAMSKGDDIPSALRLATSDMFIDEIDSFDARGLHVIARLAFICGLYGRHFVTSSATVTPEIVKMLHHAWREGYSTYQSVFGGQAHMAFITNAEENGNNLSAAMDGEDIEGMIKHMKHAGGVISKRAGAAVRFLDILPLERGEKEAQFERIFKACLALAEHHGQENMSGGFVMFNTASDAQWFTVWMLDRLKSDPDTNVKITCYTNRLSRKNRQKVERFLGELYNRKDDAWRHSEHYMRLTDNSRKKCVHIIATTSIMGVGRDYDFDWCVLEASTEKSLIQAAGRVQRHRLTRPEAANVLLMESTLKALTSKKRLRGADLFERRGTSPVLDDPLKNAGAPTKVIAPIRGLEKACDGFALNKHKAGITSCFRLTDPVSKIDEVDRRYVEYVHHECRGVQRVRTGVSVARFLHEALRKNASNPFVSTKFDSITLREHDWKVTLYLDQTEKNISFEEIEGERSMFALPLKHEPGDEIMIYYKSSEVRYNPNLGYF